jgi:autotransporter translocation and assembly factor TamB
MKKRFNVWIGFLSIIIVVACSLAWLFGTNQGAQFSIERITRTMPAHIQIGNINGKLAGGLEISDINVQLPAWEISAKRLYVRWNPFHLLGGWIGIREVSLEDVVINDLYPEVRNPYDLSWPHAKGLLSWIKARIKLFHLTNIIYK